MNLDILYQDDDILAINKPAGLLTIPDGYNKNLPNLRTLLETDFPKVYIVHRLDKETSGVLLFALSANAHRLLSIQFENRKVEKTYLVLVQGSLLNNSFTIDMPLLVNGDRKHRTIPDPIRGKPAETRIEVLRNSEFYTLVNAYPKTGYLHQIRSHLRYIGHPIVNDLLYGFEPLVSDPNFPVKRLMLHASSISFFHPTLNVPIKLETPIPEEFAGAKIKQEPDLTDSCLSL